MYLRMLSSGMLTVLVSGCGVSFFGYRDSNPVIQDIVIDRQFGVYESEFNVLSMRAERRSVFIKLANGQNGYANVCAEAPADVAEAVASAVSASIDAGIPTGTPSVSSEVNAEYARQVATTIGQLTRRSQGLQWIRDQMFYLCIEKLNGTISNEQYFDERRRLATLSIPLIEKELTILPELIESLSSENITVEKKPEK